MSSASPTMGDWVLYPWFEEYGAQLVHPSDLAALRNLRPYGRVFQMLQIEDGFCTLAYGTQTFRVQPALAQRVAAPPFAFGSVVKIKISGVEAAVAEIHWHHTRTEPFYFLTIDGKRQSKQYFAEELERCAASSEIP